MPKMFVESWLPRKKRKKRNPAPFWCHLKDFWCLYGSQTAPKMGLKRCQNSVRNAPRFERPFFNEFGAVLGSIWVLKIMVLICILKVFVDFGLSALGRAQVLQNGPQNTVSWGQIWWKYRFEMLLKHTSKSKAHRSDAKSAQKREKERPPPFSSAQTGPREEG